MSSRVVLTRSVALLGGAAAKAMVGPAPKAVTSARLEVSVVCQLPFQLAAHDPR